MRFFSSIFGKFFSMNETTTNRRYTQHANHLHTYIIRMWDIMPFKFMHMPIRILAKRWFRYSLPMIINDIGIVFSHGLNSVSTGQHPYTQILNQSVGNNNDNFTRCLWESGFCILSCRHVVLRMYLMRVDLRYPTKITTITNFENSNLLNHKHVRVKHTDTSISKRQSTNQPTENPIKQIAFC